MWIGLLFATQPLFVLSSPVPPIPKDVLPAVIPVAAELHPNPVKQPTEEATAEVATAEEWLTVDHDTVHIGPEPLQPELPAAFDDWIEVIASKYVFDDGVIKIPEPTVDTASEPEPLSLGDRAINWVAKSLTPKPLTDYHKLIELKKGVEAGVLADMNALGVMNLYGRGLPEGKNVDKAAELFKMAAEYHDLSGKGNYAQLIFNEVNYGQMSNRPSQNELYIASRYAQESSAAGNLAGLTAMGKKHQLEARKSKEPEGEFKKAAQFFKSAADKGDANGQASYGFALMSWEGVSENLPLAQKYFTISAKQRNPEGQYGLGLVFERKRLPYSVDMFRKAADNGHVLAQAKLGVILRDRDIQEALIWLEKASAQGHHPSQAALAEIFLTGYETNRGKITPADYEKAYIWSERAATGADRAGSSISAKLVIQGKAVGDISVSVEKIRELAALWHVDSMLELARLMQEGVVVSGKTLVKRDIPAANSLILKATQHVSASAELKYAELLLKKYTISVKAKLAEADSIKDNMIRHYTIAADLGDHTAQLFLANAYHTGKLGVDLNPQAAMNLYAKAAHSYVHEIKAESERMLGNLVMYGDANFPLGKQVKWFKRAADNGDPEAKLKLGRFLLDIDRVGFAASYFRTAAYMKIPAGVYWLGEAYGKGINGHQPSKIQLEKSLELFEDAAKLNYAPAFNKLGSIYHLGLKSEEGDVIVKKDIPKAVEWYKRAKEAGDPLGSRNFDRYVRAGTFLKTFTPTEENPPI